METFYMLEGANMLSCLLDGDLLHVGGSVR